MILRLGIFWLINSTLVIFFPGYKNINKITNIHFRNQIAFTLFHNQHYYVRLMIWLWDLILMDLNHSQCHFLRE